MFRELRFLIFINVVLLAVVVFIMAHGIGDVLVPVSRVSFHAREQRLAQYNTTQPSVPQEDIPPLPASTEAFLEITAEKPKHIPDIVVRDTEQDVRAAVADNTAPPPLFTLDETILFDVSFTPQAPFAEWDQDVFQYGCEEAVAIMAMHWVRDKPLSLQEAKQEILAIADFEQEAFGEFRDLSAKDTAQMIRDYFDYPNVEFMQDITTDDIKAVLAEGALAIIPVNAIKLNNPFFTPPGPEEHMIIIRGYDPDTKEFIANDPGTKRGEAFRYAKNTIERSLRDYKMGWREPVERVYKNMIVVRPSTVSR